MELSHFDPLQRNRFQIPPSHGYPNTLLLQSKQDALHSLIKLRFDPKCLVVYHGVQSEQAGPHDAVHDAEDGMFTEVSDSSVSIEYAKGQTEGLEDKYDVGVGLVE